MPTPVMSSTNVSDSASIRSPKSICSAPAGIHEYSLVSVVVPVSAVKNRIRP